MLRVSNLCKFFGEREVLKCASFTIGRGQKLALVGTNGAGKSTVLKILASELEPDSGYVCRNRWLRIGYLPQQMESLDQERAIGSFLMPEAFEAIGEMRALERIMALGEITALVEERYAEAVEHFEQLGSYALEARIERVLSGLGLESVALDRSLSSLSGGQKTRLALARLLVLDADLLLLDEPTNNLDVQSIEWLESAIEESRSSYLIVSHDRCFLDRTTTRTLELDPSTCTLKEYGGNYTFYRQRKQQEEERQLRESNEQHRRIRRLKADIVSTKEQSHRTENATTNDYLRGRSKKVAAKAKARETRMNRLLSAEQKIEKPRSIENIRLEIPGRKLYDSPVLSIRDGTIERAGMPILGDLNLSLVGSSRVSLVGCNGSGKSSLIKALIGELDLAEGEIERRADLKIGYLPQDDDLLPGEKTVLEYFWEVAETSDASRDLLEEGRARTFLHRFLFSGNQVFQQLSNLSRGERTKLKLATFMAQGVDLLILDEPTNHLDLISVERLEEALLQFSGALIIVCHDRYFLERIKPEYCWCIEDGEISVR